MSDPGKATATHGLEIRGEMFTDPDAHLSEEERAKLVSLLSGLDLLSQNVLTQKQEHRLAQLCILYLLAFLDRTNIGNAKIAGLNEDLHLTQRQYNATLTIFFVSYAVFEPLTNILLKRLRPSIFIPVIMILWGTCMVSMGFVHNWEGLMVARWFLGLTEAGLFPGVNYYLSCWYRRSEFGIRAAVFFSAAALSGSFGGALAAGLEQMNGIGNLAGWSWIFILEGLLTVVFGVASFWMVHDFPDEAKFLSPDDRARVIRRLKADQQASAVYEEFKMKYFWQAMADWKMWMAMVIYMGCDMPLYAFSLFLPTIINDLGWNTSTVRSQLMTVPPYAVAAVFTIIVGWVADKTRQRGLCNVFVSLIGIAGFVILITTESPKVKYAGTFLGAMALYPCISNTITWVANNTEGVYKRGVVLGFVIGWGNLSGIISSNIYFNGPQFTEGHGVVLAYLSLCLCLGSLLMTVSLKVENAKRKQGKRDHWAVGKTEKEIEALGDMRPRFQYTL
ncbi:major facilitator superfamily transporter [Colletotrichum truncatum]|uniref:Major facilitator superfamily transporter n=1 Tax=Colletotrichum truncatum TaxID=5467 RepID=A0ACC3Z2U0_COLTU|nr:major facilitator superfamily transporter [Colletotrichum truncatum]KAF6793295.1 major facilitator superfamily transporter [Colletotrichum truncatum]